MFRYILLLLMVASSALFKEIECFFGGSSYRLKTTGARAPIHVAEQVNHNRAILSQLSQQDSRAWRRHASARRLFNNSPRLDEGEEEEEEEGEEESSTTEGAEDTPMVSDEMSLFKEVRSSVYVFVFILFDKSDTEAKNNYYPSLIKSIQHNIT